MSTSWMGSPHSEMAIGTKVAPVPTLVDMSSTLLTKRRAVDHCRVRSALCRMR